jgi:hypothetical protein
VKEDEMSVLMVRQKVKTAVQLSGYTYGSTEVARSPVSLEDLELPEVAMHPRRQR